MWFLCRKARNCGLWTTYGTHYNDDCFQDPLGFNPSRFKEPIRHLFLLFIPFEGGPRVRATYQLAKLNILIFVHFIVTHYDWSLLCPDEPITMDPFPFSSHGMPIKISPKVVNCYKETKDIGNSYCVIMQFDLVHTS